MPDDISVSTNGPLGIIGLGLLGSALAERALAGGLEVLGFDIAEGARTHLQEHGGQPVASALEVASRCQRLLLVLPHDGIAREVIQSVDSQLSPGMLILDATTGDAEQMAGLGQTLAEHGVTYLDMCVSGSSEQARRGEALLMVGGPKTAFDQCQELFDVLARQAIYAGPCGSGAKLKLVTNLVLGLNRAALAEGLTFATVLGLDPTLTLTTLRASAAYSNAMDAKGEKMILGDFVPQARLSQHLKDVKLILTAAARTGQQLPLTEAHRKLLEFAEELGLGELDNSAILRAIERLKKP